MRAAIVVIVALATLLLVGFIRYRNLAKHRQQLEAENTRLRAAKADPEHQADAEQTRLRNRYDEQLNQLRNYIRQLNTFAFRVPIGSNVRILRTPIGTFAIRTAGGYYANTGILVYFPIGFGFSQEIADAYRKASDGKFIMDPAPGGSNGGDDTADAIITAGRDYDAHCRGEQGYFKGSPPPDLDEVATVLAGIIVHPRGVTAEA